MASRCGTSPPSNGSSFQLSRISSSSTWVTWYKSGLEASTKVQFIESSTKRVRRDSPCRHSGMVISRPRIRWIPMTRVARRCRNTSTRSSIRTTHCHKKSAKKSAQPARFDSDYADTLDESLFDKPFNTHPATIRALLFPKNPCWPFGTKLLS